MTGKGSKKQTSPRELKRQVSINKNKSDRLEAENSDLAKENSKLREMVEAQSSDGFQGFSMGGQDGAETTLSAPVSGMEEIDSEEEQQKYIEIHDTDHQESYKTYSQEEIDEAVAHIRSVRAIDNPVLKTGTVDTEDQETGQMHERVISPYGDAENAIDEPEPILIQDKYVSEGKMAEMAFMEELVTVIVADTDDPAQQPIPVCINDGVRQAFIRGIEVDVKRKFVEILARCKKTSYTNQRYINELGDESYKAVPHTTLMFPFQVTKDTSGIKGLDWLRRLQAEPG